MRSILFFTILLLATACSKPVANFLVEGDTQLIFPITFKNISTNAEKYTWKVDDKIVSEDVDLQYYFYESGRHSVQLIATKGHKSVSEANDVFIDPPSTCLVLLKTNYGNMTLSLNEETPMHLQNFVDMVNSGYYEGVIFHRVMDGFMIQGGDDKLRKTRFKGIIPDVIQPEINNSLYHTRGALAAARMPDEINPGKNSSSTQFYIVDGRSVDEDKLKDTESSKLINYSDEQIEGYLSNGGAPQLDGEYTVFGLLVDGFDVLEAISVVKTNERDKPLEEVVILEAKILN